MCFSFNEITDILLIIWFPILSYIYIHRIQWYCRRSTLQWIHYIQWGKYFRVIKTSWELILAKKTILLVDCDANLFCLHTCLIGEFVEFISISIQILMFRNLKGLVVTRLFFIRKKRKNDHAGSKLSTSTSLYLWINDTYRKIQCQNLCSRFTVISTILVNVTLFSSRLISRFLFYFVFAKLNPIIWIWK